MLCNLKILGSPILHGWVSKFKKRFNIKAYTRHCEDAYADTLTKVLRRMEEIITIVSEYDSDDVFSIDETGTLYKLEPNQTLTTMRLYGKKKQKERITVALTANATRGICLSPLIINQYLKPWDFTSRNIHNPKNLGIKCAANKKVWITTVNLLDKFSGHQVPNVGIHLRVTQLEILPPNTTSRFQPMDVDIIAIFKAQYQKLVFQYQID